MAVSLVEVVEFFLNQMKEDGVIKKNVKVLDVETDGMPEFVYVNLDNGEGFRIDLTLPKGH
jgi:hypothetical protein